jgi:hypothetical protein
MNCEMNKVNKLREVREELERVRRKPIRSEQEAIVAEEAARLVGELLSLEARVDRVLGSPHEPPASASLAGLTLHEAARRILKEAGTPLHARDLGARIKARGWRHPRSEKARPDQIVFQLAARLPKHPGTFRRVAPNTFALAEWGAEAFGPKRQAPRVALFSGPRRPIGREIGESSEPVSESSHWRSS